MRPEKILIADDETHVLNVVSIKLANAGFQVITATDGAEAYRLALETQPDLIITDYQMPYLSGVELCARLVADPAMREIPAFLLTARGFFVNQEDQATANIKRVIAKPFSPRELLGFVEEIFVTRAEEMPVAVGHA